jgi:hypothetical protein
MGTGVEKPSREVCKREAQRLAGKPFAPADPIAVGVVVDEIRECARDAAHAQRIVRWLLEHIERWPDVPDIREAAVETRDTELCADPECSKCGGSGYAPASRVIDGVKYEACLRCFCWRYVRVQP